MTSDNLNHSACRFAVLAITIFLLSLFTPLVENHVSTEVDSFSDIELKDEQIPNWSSDSIITDDVHIREILIDPLGDDAGQEAVILWNNDSAPASVGGWRLADGSLSTLFTFPDGYSMMPYIPYIITLGEGEDIEWEDQELSPTLLHTGSVQEHLLLSSGSLTLLGNQSSGAVIDFVAWGDGTGSPTTAEQQAVSAGQWTSGDFVDTSGWQSEGKGLARDRGTLDTNSSTDFTEQPGIVINEVAFDVPSSDVGGEWIELFNPGAATQQLGGWELVSNNSSLYTFPDGALLLGGQRVVLHLGNQLDLDDYFLDSSSHWIEGGMEVFAEHSTPNLLDWGVNASGDLALYSGTPDQSTIIDYLAWGDSSYSNASVDAIASGKWVENESVSISEISENDSIGRDSDGSDSDTISDWGVDGGNDANGPTPGDLNRMRVTILDINWSSVGAEVLVVENFGSDIDVDGWKVMNQSRQTALNLPSFNFTFGSTLRIVFNQGVDDLDLSGGNGTIYVGPLGSLTDGDVALLLLWSGNADDGHFIDMILFEDGQPYSFNSEDTNGRGWCETCEAIKMLGSEAWAFLKNPWVWVKGKVTNAINWAIGEIKNGVLGKLGDIVDIEVAEGDGTVILWTITFSGGADFSIPITPWLSLDISVSGTAQVQKTCDGWGGSGELIVSAGLTVGRDLWLVELSVTVGLEGKIVYPGEMSHFDSGSVVTGKVVATISATLSATASIDILGYEWSKTVGTSWPLFEDSLQASAPYKRDCDKHPDETWREGNPDVQPPRGENNPFEPEGYGTQSDYSRVPRPGSTVFMSWLVQGPDSATTISYDSNEDGWEDNWCGGCGLGEFNGSYLTEVYVDAYIPDSTALDWDEHIVQWPDPRLFDGDDDGGGGGGGGGGDGGGGGAPSCDCSGAPVSHDIWVGNDGGVITNRFTMVAENYSNNSLSDTAHLDAHIYEIYDINVTSEHGWPVRIQGSEQLWGMKPGEPHRIQVLQDVPPDAAIGTVDKITITIQSRDNSSNSVTIEKFTKVANQPLGVVWMDHLDPVPQEGWAVLDGDWEYGVPVIGPSGGAASPVTAWGTNLNGNYANEIEHELLSPAVDLSELNNAQLQFSEWFNLSQDGWDQIQVSVVDLDTGEIMELSVPRTGVSDENGSWMTKHFVLSEEHLLPNVAFLFILSANYFENTAGWFIDDVAVVTCEQPLAEISPILNPAEHGSYVGEGSDTYTTQIVNPTDARVDNISLNWTLEKSKFEVFATEDFENSASWNTWSVNAVDTSTSFSRDIDAHQCHIPEMVREFESPCLFANGHTANVGGTIGGSQQSAGPKFSYGDNTNTSLISPSYDLSDMSGELWLRFAMRVDLAPSSDSVTLSYSGDDGSSWTEVSQWREKRNQRTTWLCCAPSDWNIHTLPISDVLSDSVRFRWTVLSDGQFSGEMVAIDDVALLLRTDAIILEDGRENLTLEAGASLSFQHPVQFEAVDSELTLYTMNVNLSCECSPDESGEQIELFGDGDVRQRSHSLWVLPTIDVQISEPIPGELIETEMVEMTLISTHPLLSLGGQISVELSAIDESCIMSDSTNVYDMRETYTFSFGNLPYCNDGLLLLSATLLDWWGRTFTGQITVNLSLVEPVIPDAVETQIVSYPAPHIDDGAIHCEVGVMIMLDATYSSGEGGIMNWTWTLQDNVTQAYGGNISVPCSTGTVYLNVIDSIGQTGDDWINFVATEVNVEPPVGDGERGLKVVDRTPETTPNATKLPPDIYEEIRKALDKFANNSKALQDIENQIRNHTNGSGEITVEFFIQNRSTFIEQYLNDTDEFNPPGTNEEAEGYFNDSTARAYTTDNFADGRQVIRVVFFAKDGLRIRQIQNTNESDWRLYELIIHEFVHVKLYSMQVYDVPKAELPFQDHDEGFEEEVKRLLEIMVGELDPPEPDDTPEEEPEEVNCEDGYTLENDVCVAVVQEEPEENESEPEKRTLSPPMVVAAAAGTTASLAAILVFFRFRKPKKEDDY